MRELALRIAKLRLEGYTDVQITEIVGIKRNTFLSRLKKIRERLAAEYPGLI